MRSGLAPNVLDVVIPRKPFASGGELLRIDAGAEEEGVRKSGKEGRGCESGG